MENKEIDNLKGEIRKLKRELELTRRKYNSELAINSGLIKANTKLATDNKYLKLDLETERLKIISLKQYIEDESNISIDYIKILLKDKDVYNSNK